MSTTSTAQSDTTRIALVTGASSGIGREAAIALNHAGWIVILTGRRREALEETVQLIGEGRHPRTTIVVGDLARQEFVEALFEIISSDFGRLDLLFNNAGMSSPKTPFEDLSFDTFQTVMDVNVSASFACAQAAYRIMKSQTPQGGRIINNGSISAYVPRPNATPYTMSKHAISGLTKSIALEGRAYNIACSQLDIGNAQTAMSLNKGSTGALQANGDVITEPGYDARYAGEAVVYMASLPLHVNVLTQTLMATSMPYVGRG